MESSFRLESYEKHDIMTSGEKEIARRISANPVSCFTKADLATVARYLVVFATPCSHSKNDPEQLTTGA
jgi:hypothetical protein